MAVVTAALLLIATAIVHGKYDPTWESLDTRPLPSWYDEAKLGIFVHWGVFSVPSYSLNSLAEWFWWDWKGENNTALIEFMQKNYPPGFEYADFAPQFTAEFFEPNKWADILKSSGAKYIVFTSKHHEGFTNWPSATSWNWNSVDVGPRRDIVGELAMAIRNKTDLKFGLYHSLFEWFNPLYLTDKANTFHTSDFVKRKTMPELFDIVNTYKPDVVWSDGDWEAYSKYWQATEFLAWLYNESPVKDVVVTNDRWGKDATCKHGGFLTCDDRYNPGVLQPRKWENAMTIDRVSWGFRRNANLADYMSIKELIETFITTISCGGNMLMNVGPTKAGTIAPIYQERLKQMGEWLSVVGEAVYSTVPWLYQNDTLTKGVWYTADANGEVTYAFFFTWPLSGVLSLGCPVPGSGDAKVYLLGANLPLKWAPLKPAGIVVDLSTVIPTEIPNKWVWVLKLVGF